MQQSGVPSVYDYRACLKQRSDLKTGNTPQLDFRPFL
jgi:hypothetical protein